MLQILHNPRCGKSRNCLVFLKDFNKQFEVIDYLKKPLTITEIEVLLKKLNLKPLAIVRQKETIWIENYKDKSMSDSDIIKALVKHPILIERPIVIDGDKAIIAREIDKLEDFI